MREKRMKKISLLVIMIGLMLLSLTACSKKEQMDDTTAEGLIENHINGSPPANR